MAGETAEDSWVELPDAFDSLRRDLVAAWWDMRQYRACVRLEPVELAIQPGATRIGQNSVGGKWHVLELGGERSRETTTMQMLKLRLTPMFRDGHNVKLPEAGQLISDRDEDSGRLVDLKYESE